ncbi:Octicosapeptide/Phox/Bem1p family protein [Melia azedarach]|uniref:Octicosapeptide/Phox/Bem1p family protein n=1 Tax=Melia azedarach TaxID=155640 RepID=A0ACC1Y4R3_MELAZ|nr:Octicosapeptide/Phox/Bem1p family protein [Melia azedarach]
MSMASEGGGDEMVSSLNSPRSRVKFLCSYGGKILPRAVDGHLKYVGGETRVIAIPRDIKFSELMKKVSVLHDGDMVLKYQLIPEDLDSLVSVRTDEDVKHMLEEYDRHESEGTVRLRAFLFPSNPVVVDNPIAPVDPLAVEQRYIDAINGIVRTTGSGRLTPIKATRSSFSISSACSSPKSPSPDSTAVESFPHDLVFSDGYQNSRLSMDGYQNSRLSMHKVQSSPSLCNLSSSHHQNSSASNHHFYQPPHHCYQNHHQHLPPNHSYQAHRSPPLSLAQAADYFRQPPLYQSRSYSASKNYLGHSSHSKYGCFDEPVYFCRRPERAGSLPHSPRKGNAQ